VVVNSEWLSHVSFIFGGITRVNNGVKLTANSSRYKKPKKFYDWQTAGGTNDVMRMVDCLERADNEEPNQAFHRSAKAGAFLR
jgi:hypothetical protein